MSTTRGRRLVGPWLVEFEGEQARDALHLVDLQRVRLEGSLAESLGARLRSEAAPSDPTLDLAARLQPALTDLLEAKARHGVMPYDRAALIKGTGYQQLFVELTDQCNERCVHCYADASPERDTHLPWEWLDAALVDAVALGFRVIQLTGGDPLVSPLVLRAARRLDELGANVIEIYTNGLRLRGELFEGLAALGCRFAFSLYGHDPAIHDAVTRTPGSHARTLNAIERAAARGLGVRVSVIITGDVSDDLGPTYDLLGTRGVSRDAVSIGGSTAVGRGDFVPLRTSRHAMERLPAAGTSEGTPNAGHATGGDRFEGFGGRVAITPDGAVVPCIFDRDFPLGHLRDARLRNILEAREIVDGGIEAAEGARIHANRLSCRECQVRSSLLTSPGAAR